MCFPKILFPLFMLAFIFSLPLIFTLLAASISHFFTAAMKFSCFFFPKEIRLLCLQSLALALSLCYPREKKDTTLLFFFLSKSPGGHAISFQIKP